MDPPPAETGTIRELGGGTLVAVAEDGSALVAAEGVPDSTRLRLLADDGWTELPDPPAGMRLAPQATFSPDAARLLVQATTPRRYPPLRRLAAGRRRGRLDRRAGPDPGPRRLAAVARRPHAPVHRGPRGSGSGLLGRHGPVGRPSRVSSGVTCVHCDHALDGADARAAFDPWLGRLWRICPRCGRWNVVPLEDRWETLEALERAVRDTGRSLLRTEHLDLVRIAEGEVVRIGRAPRPEVAGWRYGDALPPVPSRGVAHWLRRLFLTVPSAPHGYDTSEIGTLSYPFESARWFASPFIEDAPALTAVFAHVAVAPGCPACGRPLRVAPWSFERVRLTLDAGEAAVQPTCVSCGAEPVLPLGEVRPALRLGLFMVNRRVRAPALVGAAARAVDRAGGAEGVVRRLASEASTVGDAGPRRRLALQIALDELAEAELLETGWRYGEEIAAIVDGELTDVG